MSTSSSRPTLSRRNFLKLTAAVGVTAAGAHLLDTYAPWLDYDQSALGLGGAAPQLLVRYGYAAALPRSLRRPVAQVLI